MQTRRVFAIGNFDGVHLGHAALIEAAHALGGETGVLTFEPHPRQFFAPAAEPFRLTLSPMKKRLLSDLGVETIVELPFDAELASLQAEEFIERILISKLAATDIVVGSDFHFGHKRGGNVETLQKDGRFAVHRIDLVGGISSTAIRAALKAGEMEAANEMLGWRWAIEGVVEHGDKRGRELGYPTANIPLGQTLCPAYGIYAVLVRIGGDPVWRPGAASIGIRPMFEVQKPLLEAYLFDFDGDLYDKSLSVRPVKRLRGEMKFDTLEALKDQMAQDCAQARWILASKP